MEEVDAVAELETGDVEVVEDGPEGADIGDASQELEAGFVATIRVCFVGGVGAAVRGYFGRRAILSIVPEVPAVY